MVLSPNQIRELAKDNEPDAWIIEARKDYEKYILHYYGIGVTKALTRLQNLETKKQIELRRKYALSNEWLVEVLLRNVDYAWGAKGGLKTVEAPTDEVKKNIIMSLTNLVDGYSHNQYMEHFWFDYFVTDPNGLTFYEVSTKTVDGKKTNEAVPTYKSIEHIQKMEVSGITPEYVKFEPEVEYIQQESLIGTEKTEVEKCWIVDDKYYYQVKNVNGEVKIIQQIENSWGYVPGFQNSPIVDTKRGIKISPIHKQIGLLDKYLNNGSIHEIFTFLHGYPVPWEYQQPCESCKGRRKVKSSDGTLENCNECNGTGYEQKKDVSDKLVLAVPEDKEAPQITPHVGGFISAPVEAWQEQIAELDRTQELLYYSHWGTNLKKGNGETATGRFIDAEQVKKKLEKYSDVFSIIHKRLIQIDVDFEYPTTEKIKVICSYGNIYMIETATELLRQYAEGKKNKLDFTTLDNLLFTYYETEYEKNDYLRVINLKYLKLDPLVHYTLDEVLTMQLPEILKQRKLAFIGFKRETDQRIIFETPYEQLNNQLTEYTNQNLEQ